MSDVEMVNLERLLRYANVASVVLVVALAVLGVFIYNWTQRLSAEKDRRLEHAQLEIRQLKEPRTITQADRAEIVAALKQFAGQRFSFMMHDGHEARSLVEVLDKTLKSAGWIRVSAQTDDSLFRMVAGDTVALSINEGVFVGIGLDNADAAPAVAALADTLRGVGIRCRKGETPFLEGKTPKAILIDVGEKRLD
ncbi:MAG: hypothetical protein F4X59_14440 [Holophagales bacterium]|nr:hypothetical protein [Holophagales bacterium]